MNTIQTAKRVLGMVRREVKSLEKKKSKARDVWLKAMHAAEAKASTLNGLTEQLKVAEEKLEDYEKEVEYYARHGKRKSTEPGETMARLKRVGTKKASKKVAKKAPDLRGGVAYGPPKKAPKKVAKKSTKKTSKKKSKRS